jgi:hypothetical protein
MEQENRVTDHHHHHSNPIDHLHPEERDNRLVE